MPDKSQHGKGKYYRRSKKSRAKHRHTVVTVQQNEVAESHLSEATPIGAPSPVAVSSSPVKSRMVQYPYIFNELRKIGILAGIILVILIVLALVLS